jgi:hypothetical protein
VHSFPRLTGRGRARENALVATVSVCPSAVVEAPVDRVWELVTHPEEFGRWADAALVVAEPPGHTALGWTVAAGWSEPCWRASSCAARRTRWPA